MRVKKILTRECDPVGGRLRSPEHAVLLVVVTTGVHLNKGLFLYYKIRKEAKLDENKKSKL